MTTIQDIRDRFDLLMKETELFFAKNDFNCLKVRALRSDISDVDDIVRQTLVADQRDLKGLEIGVARLNIEKKKMTDVIQKIYNCLENERDIIEHPTYKKYDIEIRNTNLQIAEKLRDIKLLEEKIKKNTGHADALKKVDTLVNTNKKSVKNKNKIMSQDELDKEIMRINTKALAEVTNNMTKGVYSANVDRVNTDINNQQTIDIQNEALSTVYDMVVAPSVNMDLSHMSQTELQQYILDNSIGDGDVAQDNEGIELNETLLTTLAVNKIKSNQSGGMKKSLDKGMNKIKNVFNNNKNNNTTTRGRSILVTNEDMDSIDDEDDYRDNEIISFTGKTVAFEKQK